LKPKYEQLCLIDSHVPSVSVQQHICQYRISLCVCERVMLQWLMRQRGWILNMMKILMENRRRMRVTQI